MRTNKKLCIVTIILCFIITITNMDWSLVANAESTEEEDIVIVESVSDCKLKKEPSKYSDIAVSIPKGTLLYSTGSIVNDKEHVWFKISYFGNTVYCYSNNIKEHVHSYDVLISEEFSEDRYSCKCGQLDTEDGLINTFAPALAVGIPLAELGYDALLATGIYVGARIASKYVVPVMINEAGALISITAEELEEKVKKLSENNNSDENEDSNDAIFYKCQILSSENSDTLELIDFSNPLSMNEACNFVDSTLCVAGAFGRLKKFSVSVCNIYTVEDKNAIALCEKIKSCGNNTINKYGDKTGNEYIYDVHSQKYIEGSYCHYHLFNSFDQKSVVHILYGNMLHRSQAPTTY